ncbi:hypothetical protein CSUNSWCD_991 [Campylobacter showae CSUNSWCD]|uniref:Uncharacterized protein n=1 Tax=Campylobacter showae CSUNSWCD TaxID=1244083 RepID=M5ING1_9BACT|nr:hypothetical protein CSUNSWCD_991 [Campylobacter showae CSUNSWCD]
MSATKIIIHICTKSIYAAYHINPLKRVLSYIGKFEKKFRVKIRKAIKFSPYFES